jgi:hypothetical protein
MHTALTRWAEDNGQTKLPELIARALAASFGDVVRIEASTAEMDGKRKA